MPNFRQQAQALAQQLTIAIAEARYWQQQAGQRMAAADQRQREALRTLRRARPLGRHQRKLDRSGTRRLCDPQKRADTEVRPYACTANCISFVFSTMWEALEISKRTICPS